MMRYNLSGIGNGMGVGWFSCIPENELDFEAGIKYIKDCPFDQFMHRRLLDLAGKYEPESLRTFIHEVKEGDFTLLALIYEACIMNTKFHDLKGEFSNINIKELSQYTPLIYIDWSSTGTFSQHLYWLRLFSKNINLLNALPPEEELELPIPFERDAIDEWQQKVITINAIHKRTKGTTGRPFNKAFNKQIGKKLEQLGILSGWETRTDATISPFAVERPWNLDITCDNGRNCWRLTGSQTSYGRGLNIHQARISCLMEAVERYSAFADIGSGRACGYKKDYSLIKARYGDMKNNGLNVLDPNELCLEVPYKNQELYWMEGEMVDKSGSNAIYVPAQMVFLFSNFDEICLTSGLSSNGLAAGNSIEEAKLSSILEVIERDAEKVVPYSMERLFLLESEDRKVADIIGGCKEKGIQIQFLDITSEFGIPCYKAFIQGPGGIVLKGSAANLDGRRAVLSAMTEIPYPYPYWFGSMPAPKSIKTISDEMLPCFSTGVSSDDLGIIERLMIMNGYKPIYVDLTRKNLDIPVVKTLIPGLEIMTIYDRFTPIGLRQFAHYLRADNESMSGN
ncbi:MAG: YcaO-like family protein [Deltaproteobacteria bacterium]|nr:YcaO-like family protein [Deltaproteobacteria bacterium]